MKEPCLKRKLFLFYYYTFGKIVSVVGVGYEFKKDKV